MLPHPRRSVVVLATMAMAVLPLHQASAAEPLGTGIRSAVASEATVARLTVSPTVTLSGAKKKIPWPVTGRAQLYVAGIGTLGHSGTARSVPIASVTKVMTAYLILRDHQLDSGEQGPTIRVTRAEADAYARRKANGETVVKVVADERISERKALQGVLIPSGNNMADILARWDAGTTAKFVTKMNATAKSLGMTSTHYVDASGLNQKSRSNPADLIVLARAAMKDTTFRSIVKQKSATIPYNSMKNTNTLLGKHGVVGIKTGFTTPAGGCLLFATQRTVAGKSYTVYGAYLGAGKLASALSGSDKILVAGRAALASRTLIPAGRTVATVTISDGTVVTLGPAKALTAVGWNGLKYTLSLPAGLRAGQIPTTLTASTPAGHVSVALKVV
jgi:D-alanyl-D-alanine carboxypeptidase (penicillin-binding protein 5/6)